VNFNELSINNAIKAALQKRGFEKPSEIQEKVIPAALLGKDIVGKSKTGTGKTAAFAIPLIEKSRRGQEFSALVVVPTRELAIQVKEEIKSIAIGSGIKITAVFGGQKISKQIDLLSAGPEIVVGTPGRLIDLVSRKALYLGKAGLLVLDEADRMFDMGFRQDIERIISFLPKNRQTMLFSATMPEEIMGLADRHLRSDRIVFDLSTDNAPVSEIEQFFVMAQNKTKLYALMKVLKSDDSRTLVFCRTKRTVDWLERQLSSMGIRTLAIHGDKPQNVRNKIIEIFKNSPSAILIATDIVARGIHVDDIRNVVNFDFPSEPETYIHRIGRAARQGKTGRAISICLTNGEVGYLDRIAERNNSVVHEFR